MISDLYKFSDGWHWNIDYIKEHIHDKHIFPLVNIKYLCHNDDIYIVYYKPLDKSDRHTLLCYSDYVRPFHCKIRKLDKINLCNFCSIYTDVVKINIYGEDFHICDKCRNMEPSNENIYTNTKFHDNYKHEVEYIINTKGQYFILYSLKLEKCYTFSYLMNLKWFQYSEDGFCNYCDLKPKFYKSVCKDCYYFIYNLCFNNYLHKYYLLKDVFVIDIVIVIMDLCLSLLGFNNTTVQDLQPKCIKLPVIINITNKIENKVEEIIVDNEDIIDENNIDCYLVEEHQEDYSDLGTWSDDETF